MKLFSGRERFEFGEDPMTSLQRAWRGGPLPNLPQLFAQGMLFSRQRTCSGDM